MQVGVDRHVRTSPSAASSSHSASGISASHAPRVLADLLRGRGAHHDAAHRRLAERELQRRLRQRDPVPLADVRDALRALEQLGRHRAVLVPRRRGRGFDSRPELKTAAATIPTPAVAARRDQPRPRCSSSV